MSVQQDTVYTGQLKIANMVLTNTQSLMNGALKVSWRQATKATRGILCVQNQLNIGDTSSPNFLIAYACLQAFIGQYGAGAIDPNAQNPGTTINVNNLVNFNQTKIVFSNVTSLTLSNYNTVYAPFYGNDPILGIVLDTEFGDFQYIPVYTYAIPGNASSAITAITYNFVTAVSGYLSISGPGQLTGSGGASGGVVVYTFNQGSLMLDVPNNQYYLELPLPVGKTVGAVTDNSVSQSCTYDTTFSPGRLYAFAPSSVTQVISVWVIG